jgi:hypothetical protein
VLDLPAGRDAHVKCCTNARIGSRQIRTLTPTVHGLAPAILSIFAAVQASAKGFLDGSWFSPSADVRFRPRQGLVHQRAEIGLDHLDLALRHRNQGRQIVDHLYGGFAVGGPASDGPPGLRTPPRGMEANPLGARTPRLQPVAHGSGRTRA